MNTINTIIITIAICISLCIVAKGIKKLIVKGMEKTTIKCTTPKESKEPITITTPYVVLTHSDMDGAGPGIIAKHYFGSENVTIFPTSNNAMHNAIKGIKDWVFKCPKTKVFITDISCSLDIAKDLEKWLKNQEIEIRLFDHHKTALALNEVSFCKVMVEKDENSYQILKDTSKGYGLSCGTSLFYEYVTNELGFEKNVALNELVRIINAYDTWMWQNEEEFHKDEYFAKWNRYFFLIGFDKFVENALMKVTKNEIMFNDADEWVLMLDEERANAYIKRCCQRLYFRKWHKYNTCFVLAENYLSELSDYIFANYENVEILAMITPKSTSLRTRTKGIDVAAIAKKRGGGGHSQAAGFPLPKGIWKNIFWKI